MSDRRARGAPTQRRLRDDIREVYLSKEPSQATLERLTTMEAAARPQRASWMRRSNRFLLVAAGLAASVAAPWIALLDRDTGAIVRSIASEIAMNHNKGLDVEFETASYADLRRIMDRLDFSLVEPGRVGAGSLRLVGARYCSIRGQLAAQLRLETDSGESRTFYQTTLTDDLKGLEWTGTLYDGLTIELWQEGGVFLGMARGP